MIGTVRVTCLCATMIPVLAILVPACSRSNNLLLGRVEARVGAHTVVVTDCYRIGVSPPEQIEDSANGQAVYRFRPCRDADMLIRGDELFVNGRSYGHIDLEDAILVDHSVVSIHPRKALER